MICWIASNCQPGHAVNKSDDSDPISDLQFMFLSRFTCAAFACNCQPKKLQAAKLHCVSLCCRVELILSRVKLILPASWQNTLKGACLQMLEDTDLWPPPANYNWTICLVTAVIWEYQGHAASVTCMNNILMLYSFCPMLSTSSKLSVVKNLPRGKSHRVFWTIAVYICQWVHNSSTN